MNNLKIYGIPNCDSIKKTKKFLEANNIDYEFIDFRKTPLNIQDIEKFITEIGLDLLVNRRSTTWKQLSETEKNKVGATTILKNPTLMKRPIVIKDSLYFVGYDEAKLKD
jgi:arsenate reductase